jgi:hypothetical protein
LPTRARRPSDEGSRASSSSLSARGEDGRRPLRADGHHDWVAVHDGRRDEGGGVEVVHDVDERPVGPRQGRHAGVLGVIVGGRVGERGAHRVARLEGAAAQGEAALGGEALDLGAGSGCEDRDGRAGSLSRRRSFASAVSPPPATTTRRPARSRKMGKCCIDAPEPWV